MSENKGGQIHPAQITKEALSLWAGNLIPLVAINATTVIAQMALVATLRATGPMKEAIRSGEINAASFVLFGIFVISSIVINSFLCLVALNTLRRKREARPYLLAAAKDAIKRTVPFLKSFFFVWCFIIVGIVISALFFQGGRALYALTVKSLGHGLALALLLATSTVFVVVAISVAWYSFFFSLAPLIAAYEHKPAIASLRFSRDRIRGNALRYLAAFAIIFVLYFVVGLGIYGVITRFTHNKLILELIDPDVLLVFGPAALATWYVSYKKLTELKGKTA
ncbi:MAG: hypothetical protein HZB36_03565 [Candidatus Omnitrophica bacterium]|nr:hypothetical protein [Candidatus Omnitrophota bacterium]